MIQIDQTLISHKSELLGHADLHVMVCKMPSSQAYIFSFMINPTGAISLCYFRKGHDFLLIIIHNYLLLIKFRQFHIYVYNHKQPRSTPDQKYTLSIYNGINHASYWNVPNSSVGVKALIHCLCFVVRSDIMSFNLVYIYLFLLIF